MIELCIENRIRALAHDEPARIFTDEVLRPFIEQAAQSVPYLALALLAQSRGMTDQAAFWLRLLPGRWESVSEESPKRVNDVLIAASELAQAGTACGAGELPYKALHKLYDAVREMERGR